MFSQSSSSQSALHVQVAVEEAAVTVAIAAVVEDVVVAN
jgi:hypothetical protein